MARNKIEIPDDVRKEDKENVNHGTEGTGDGADKVGFLLLCCFRSTDSPIFIAEFAFARLCSFSRLSGFKCFRKWYSGLVL